MFDFFKKNLLGIDIGASAVKVVSGVRNKHSFQIKHLAAIPLPFRAKDERGISNPEVVKAALVEAINGLGLKNPQFATSIYGAGVQAKMVTLPKMPRKEIPMQARFEAQQIFPSEGGQILSDYLFLGEGGQAPGAPPKTKGWELLLVGIRQEEANLVFNLIESCGVNVLVMDVDSFALGDFLEPLLNFSHKEAVGIIDVGASATHVSVRYKGNTIFLRDFYIGGFSFTESISQALGMTLENAEALKIQDGGGIPQEALDALQGVFSSWKNELRQCEDIFVSQNPNIFVSKWHIGGGASQTPGLLASLQGDRLAERVVPISTQQLFTLGNKQIDSQALSLWSGRILSAAALSCRKV